MGPRLEKSGDAGFGCCKLINFLMGINFINLVRRLKKL